MNKINKRIEKIKKENRLGLMTHIVAGYPNMQESKEIVIDMSDLGVDFVEVQIPFSDPMADGPTIMEANKVSLDNGTTVAESLDLIKELNNEVDTPLIIMTYYNIISNFGVTKFCKKASEVGVSGLIVPDMPIEENDTEKFYEEAQKNDLINIRLLSPISTVDRIKKNIDIAEGMIYFVSRQGTTGAKKEMDKKLSANVNMLKKFTRLPVGVGFGISSPEHIETLKKTDADVAVIGSAVIKAYKKSGLSGVKTFLSNIIKSL